jgi:hypothetical protein
MDMWSIHERLSMRRQYGPDAVFANVSLGTTSPGQLSQGFFNREWTRRNANEDVL